MNLGKPDEDFKNEKGNLEFVYNTKKYGIPCERRFEINSNSNSYTTSKVGVFKNITVNKR